MNAIANLAEYRSRHRRSYHPSTELQRHACEEKRNIGRLNDFRIKFAELRALRYRRAEHTIRDIICTYPPDAIDQALTRARRVLEGGGTIECAVYHALGGNPDGPEIA